VCLCFCFLLACDWVLRVLNHRYFAGEIIGNVLDLDPRRWMRPRKVDYRHNKDRIQRLKKMYDKFDWTGLIGKS